jgi:hypothetical protein
MAMTSTSSAETHPAPRAYRSPPHALVWSFRKSRDNWKRKCLDVKAQLRRLRRRLDRLTQPKRTSPSLPAPSAKPVAAPPACLAVLLRALLDLRQQVQDNRELLEQGQQQHLMLLDLARQIQQLAADTPTSAPPPPTQAAQPLSTVSYQAPAEPKKGAPHCDGP